MISVLFTFYLLHGSSRLFLLSHLSQPRVLRKRLQEGQENEMRKAVRRDLGGDMDMGRSKLEK